MTERPPLSWKNKPVEELDRDELIELVGVLQDLVWKSAENFEVVHAFNKVLIDRHGGNA